MDIVDCFDAYVKCGFKPLPLYHHTKIPVAQGWQTNWSVERYRDYFVDNSNANIGILLGDIMDVEGDDKTANERIMDMARNTPHPMFRSNKSVHHLFVSPDPTITLCVVGRIEFRGKHHQSAMPPSVHESGVKYAWLKDSEFPPPSMPQRLASLLYSNRKNIRYVTSQQSDKKSGHIATICNQCEKKIFVHKKRLALEVKAFAILGSRWFCQRCRKVDVRQLCRDIRPQA